MASLDEIRAKLMAQQTRSEGGSNQGGGDRASYPFWNIPDDSTAVLRFLPDSDPNNTFFWVERLVIKLPFQGIRGEHTNEVTVQVPCMEMYGKSCPILTETRPWWKEKELEDLARKYWKKKSYLFQGFVVTDPLKEENKPENPIRRFIVNPSVFTIIKASLMDPEMEDIPTDYEAGVDFRLTKTKKGQFADYGTSSWSRKSRPLGQEERDAVSKNGLFNLREFLPKEPTDAELEIIKQMFQDSVDGKPYDPSKYSQYYRPAGVAREENGTSGGGSKFTETVSAPVSKPVSTPVVIEDEEDHADASDALARLKARTQPAAAPVAEGGSEKQDASKILEILRNRNKTE